MAKTRPDPPGQSVFQLRIQLEDVHPVVWRRLLVAGSFRLAMLHGMFQAASLDPTRFDPAEDNAALQRLR